ncbi:uncharacterized protein F23B12.7-like [Octopus sinensis]|uniref:Uncharacterized protein F23B12.7-like n=1 Tax=Octopus sinensis TaxID=2607531 RepID=A0A6P7TDQ4_9MOLL|nr:uncharacterized protein F23B12.7-like [Octopus sinensis]
MDEILWLIILSWPKYKTDYKDDDIDDDNDDDVVVDEFDNNGDDKDDDDDDDDTDAVDGDDDSDNHDVVVAAAATAVDADVEEDRENEDYGGGEEDEDNDIDYVFIHSDICWDRVLNIHIWLQAESTEDTENTGKETGDREGSTAPPSNFVERWVNVAKVTRVNCLALDIRLKAGIFVFRKFLRNIVIC